VSPESILVCSTDDLRNVLLIRRNPRTNTGVEDRLFPGNIHKQLIGREKAHRRKGAGWVMRRPSDVHCSRMRMFHVKHSQPAGAELRELSPGRQFASPLRSSPASRRACCPACNVSRETSALLEQISGGSPLDGSSPLRSAARQRAGERAVLPAMFHVKHLPRCCSKSQRTLPWTVARLSTPSPARE